MSSGDEEPAGHWIGERGVHEPRHEAGAGVGEKGQERGAWWTEPTRGAVCRHLARVRSRGAAGAPGLWVCSELVVCLSPSVSAGLSVSMSQDAWACLKDHLPSPPGWALERVGLLGLGHEVSCS